MKHNSKMKRMRATTVLVSLMILALPLLPFVTGFANTYLEDKTMQLWKGETGEYCVYLQNTGNEEIVQVIKIFEGQEYIKNLKEVQKEYTVAVNTVSDDLPVCMKVKLPNDAEKGEKYLIGYGVTSPTSNDEEGMVSFGPLQIREKFYLTEKLEKEPTSPATYAVLALIGIAILGVIGYKIRKRRRLRLPRG